SQPTSTAGVLEQHHLAVVTRRLRLLEHGRLDHVAQRGDDERASGLHRAPQLPVDAYRSVGADCEKQVSRAFPFGDASLGWLLAFGLAVVLVHETKPAACDLPARTIGSRVADQQ